MNKRYTKRWLIGKAGLGGGSAWAMSDRQLAMTAGLINGAESRKQIREVLNSAFLTDKTPEKSKKDPNAFFTSPAWRAVRYQALVKHGARCQCCGASAADGTVLHVDHIKPRSRYPALALELSNLQVLCVDCNLGKSNKDETDWRPIEAANDHNMDHIRSIVEGR